MFKPIVMASALVLALGSAAALAQNAQGAATSARTHRVEGVESSPYNPNAPGSPEDKAAARKDDRNCLRETGSLIPAKKGHCLPVTGRTYTKDDLDRTGERKLGPALEKLDPSITTRGH
jgi:hypothetical protein